MPVREKVQVLHLWKDEKEAERLIRELAETGIDFEASLVKSESEYVSALVRKRHGIVIADEDADFDRSGPDQLSAFEIAREIAPDIPFLLIGGPGYDVGETGCCKLGFFHIPREQLNLLGPIIRKALELVES